jgi:hypothetical protein
MFLYNITIKVSNSIHEDWLQWMRDEHIPDVMSTGCFTNSSVYRLLEVDDSEGPTYAIQFKAESKGMYNYYIDKFAQEMRQKSFDKWGDAFIAFRSIMQAVN